MKLFAWLATYMIVLIITLITTTLYLWISFADIYGSDVRNKKKQFTIAITDAGGMAVASAVFLLLVVAGGQGMIALQNAAIRKAQTQASVEIVDSVKTNSLRNAAGVPPLDLLSTHDMPPTYRTI